MANQINQVILPAARTLKEFDELMESSYERIILLNAHVAQVKPLGKRARAFGKKLLIHADLIDGLKSDEYAMEFLAQEAQPEGIITTRNSAVLAAKKKGLISIQRLFLIDTMALDSSLTQLARTKPDYVEVLPGIIPHLIEEITVRTKIPVIAGGFIRTMEDVDRAILAGATSVTTSRRELWTKS
ncbi:glycerol-3-phosphate responsive antiterminator GlpP [Brevibacillus brevis]|uniref:glycerol-3-phosphate responsive antiterminator n=1 Tax=Brevibacillus brevis TaxID=1393 RepID=UPI000B38BF7B|nr:glycerol-3-phosphate responsive antiterminator [Brevibacillus brevis]OUQ85130.1 glycerol-3-phosphate responsive antiterminator GlpP [Brevibacillus brevis]